MYFYSGDVLISAKKYKKLSLAIGLMVEARKNAVGTISSLRDVISSTSNVALN